jgi:hypothetical protein
MDTFRERFTQNCRGRTIWIADAHRSDDGKRFVVHADEKLTAFLELEAAARKAQRTSEAKQLRGELWEIR